MVDYLISGEEVKRKLKPEYSKKVCFIFGAGASNGYTDELGVEPPIVKEILRYPYGNKIVKEVLGRDDHAQIRRRLTTLIPRLEIDYKNDLESFLSNLYINNKEDNTFGQFLIYLYDIFLKSSELFEFDTNYYIDLIDHMFDLRADKKNWSCISFNYDDLFEKSYIARPRDPNYRAFNSIDDYVKLDPKIIKPHGSINFMYSSYSTDDQFKGINYISHAFSTMMDDNKADESLVVIGPELSSQREALPYLGSIYREEKESEKRFRKYRIPFILIPIHEKIPAQNSFFKRMNELSVKEVDSSNLIISIGYRFNDESFVEKIRKLDLTKKEMILVDTKEDGVDTDNYKYGASDLFKKIKKQNWGIGSLKIFDGDGFEEFIRSV